MAMDMNTFREGCKELSQVLGLAGNIVTISFRDNVPEVLLSSEPVVACQAIQDARSGKVTVISKENSKCLGASYFLGFEPFSPLAYDFWVENEQSLYDRRAAEMMVDLLPPPQQDLASYIVIAPVALTPFTPDVVLAVCDPAQTARLLGLHIFKTGVPVKTYSYGATCQSAIGIPMATHELNVSYIDLPSRQIADFAPNEQIVAIPYQEMGNVFESIDKSINGTADPRFNKKGRVFLRGDWKKVRN